MHYYQFNIGDYASATAHLEPMEDLAYRRLLDLYYSNESPIADDINQVARLIRMRSYCDAITCVLEEFFTLENDGWHCERVDVEIFKFSEKSYKASKSAKSRWKKSKAKQKVTEQCESNANALETHSDGNANQEPLTINQEPLTIIKDLVESKIQQVDPCDEAFDYFWSNMKMRKAGDKKKARSSFKKACNNTDHMNFAIFLVNDTEARFNNQQQGFDRLMPPTYLNGRRWEDEYVIDKKPSNKKPSITGDGTDWRRFESEML